MDAQRPHRLLAKDRDGSDVRLHADHRRFLLGEELLSPITTAAASQASTMLMVNATQPSVAIISAAGTVYNTATFTQNLTASVTDPGSNGTYAYKWYLNQALSTQTGANFTFSDNTSNLGNDSVKVVVTDNFGNTATTTTSFQVATTNMMLTAPGPSSQQVLAVAAASGITIDASSLPSTVSVDEVVLGSNVTLLGGSGPSILQGDSGFNSLVGGSGPDTLIATSGDTLVASKRHARQPLPDQSRRPARQWRQRCTGQQEQHAELRVIHDRQTTLIVSNDTAAFPGSPNDSLILSGRSLPGDYRGRRQQLTSQRAGAQPVGVFSSAAPATTRCRHRAALPSRSSPARVATTRCPLRAARIFRCSAAPATDTMTTSGGSSITMFGGTGNDTISASGRLLSITLVAGTGNDFAVVFGRHVYLDARRLRQRHHGHVGRFVDHHVWRRWPRRPPHRAKNDSSRHACCRHGQ